MTLADYSPLADYAPGERFHSLVLAVRSVKSGTTKNGAPYADLRLGDWSSTRSAKLWNLTDAQIAALSQAEFLEVSGEVDTTERFSGDLCIQRYEIAPRPDDVAPYLEQPPASNKESRQRFINLIKSVEDAELYSVLKSVFNDLDFRRRFFRAYAASSVHHAFPGGLLEHTVEVAELCAEASRIVPGLDRDLLVAAALVHDIGKMEEMNQELRAGEYTDDGTLIGHLVLGSVRVAQAVDKHNEECAAESEWVSVKTRRALMHLILSHHGLPEYGAALKPAFAEAAVLYLCDNISAKARQHLDLVERNTVGAVSTYHQFLGGRVYLKSPRDGVATAAASSADDAKKPRPIRPDFLDEEAAPTAFVTAARALPVLGLVAAGAPDEQKSESETTNHRQCVPPPDGADYLLEVTGDSMIGAGIHDGDLLYVKRQTEAREGEIVVAHLGGEGQTVKYLRHNPKHEQGIDGPYLEAANPKYKPIPITDETRIQGRVTGLLRDL